MNKDTVIFVKQWLMKAEEDLFVVCRLTETEVVATASVCFHCQQATEKFLKAFLIVNGIDIKRTHNIEFLLSECSDIDKDFEGIDPRDLSDFGVDARYPGDMYIPDERETLEYKKLAFDIKALVESKINSLIELE